MGRAVLFIVLSVLISCKGGGGGSSGGGSTPPPPEPTYRVTGSMSYDFVPATSSGLNYAGTVQRPMRNIYLEAVQFGTDEVVASTSTDDNGNFTLDVPQDVNVMRIEITAKMVSPSVVIEDNTDDNAEYVAISNDVTITGDVALGNLNAPSGWSGSNAGGSYSSTRVSAPFAILDSIYSAIKKIRTARPSINFPALKVNWSVNNLPSNGDNELGQIGSSHYDGSELYILGKADVDTDEFDRHVIVHEWGHFFEGKLSRSDSPGGAHYIGDTVDRSLSFGEGWGNALSGIVFDPDYAYRDSTGTRQQTLGLGFSLESSTDSTPGWFSETSIQEILFDVYDSYSDASDGVNLGLGPIIDVMTNYQKTTPAATSIYSFIHGLKIGNPAYISELNTLTNGKSITSVWDAYGTGETNDGGFPATLPLYHSLTIGGSAVATELEGGSTRMNEAANNRYFRFTATSSSTTLAWTSSDTYALIVVKNGNIIFDYSDLATDATPLSGSKILATTSGQEYIVQVMTHPDYLYNTTLPVEFEISAD